MLRCHCERHRCWGQIPHQSSPTSSSGILDANFDHYHLKLNNARVQQGELIWDFTALEEGASHVVVNLIPTLPKPGEEGLALRVRTVYVINAHWPVTDLAARLNASTLSGSISTSAVPSRYITFLDRVNEAVGIVGKDERGIGAELREVYAFPLMMVSTSVGVASFPELYCTFKTKDGVASIHSEGKCGWSAPSFLPGEIPPFGTKSFETAGLYDIVTAADAMYDKIGRCHHIKRATLYEESGEVIIPEKDRPYYTFTLGDDSTVKVGARHPDVEIRGFESDKKKVNGA